MQITERSPTRLELPGGTIVRVATQRRALDRWDGEDPPELGFSWSRKPKFAVNGNRSCAELAVLDQLRHHGWQGVWVSAYAQELRRHWFPAPAYRTLTQAGAPAWAAAIFDGLRAANSGRLCGFFDVFAWREPGEVRFAEIKVGPDRIQDTQRKFLTTALRFRALQEFMIIEVPRSRRPVTGPPSLIG